MTARATLAAGVAWALAGAAAAPAPPQNGDDAGTLVVRADTVELGREQFRIASGAAAGGGEGWRLAATIRYDRARPIITLRPVLDISADTSPRVLQFDVTGGAGQYRLLAQPAPGRLTIREVAPGRERAREVRSGARVVLLDDSVFSMFAIAAWHARPTPVSVTAIYPRQGRREVLWVQDLGAVSLVLHGDTLAARRVDLTGGTTGPVHLWLDAEGQLIRVALPARGVVAERAASN